MRRTVVCTAALAASLLGAQAHANLILNTTVTGSFTGDTTTTNTLNNDWAGKPASLYLGQLGATANGFVDFYYVGNEAAYTDTLVLNGQSPAADYTHSTVGLPDSFSSIAGATFLRSIDVAAGGLVDFGFCTEGGDDTGSWDRCAWNPVSASLTQQFNHGGITGYRSIGFRALDANNNWLVGTGPAAAWGIFWDDSGAANDDNHDDYVAIARFRPVSVPEPGTTLLLGIGLLGAGLARRLRSRGN